MNFDSQTHGYGLKLTIIFQQGKCLFTVQHAHMLVSGHSGKKVNDIILPLKAGLRGLAVQTPE